MVAAVGIRVSQAAVVAAGAFPAATVRVSQAAVQAAIDANGDTIRITQAAVIVAGAGRVSDPKIRAWTFSLDNHDFYVLRLGNDQTLLYDRYAEQWYVWGSGMSDLWKAFTGQNWQGGFGWAGSGSNVLVGDDGNGSLYFLDPTRYRDDDSLLGDDSPREFLLEITGQVAVTGIDMVPCFGVQVLGAIGEMSVSDLTAVVLYTSDDRGHTWDEQETATIDNADYQARAEWWSLGSFSAPGRLFRIRDYGALPRIDYLGMMDDPDAEDG